MKKYANRIDESITPFYNTIHRLDDGLDESFFFFLVFFLEKTAFALLAFCSSVIKLRCIWWNYFLNNFNLLVGLLRLVCLLID